MNAIDNNKIILNNSYIYMIIINKHENTLLLFLMYMMRVSET